MSKAQESRAYHYYGEKGSAMRNAGGLFSYEDKVRGKEGEQRDKKLVDCFDFRAGGKKYGCDHFYTPLDSALTVIGKQFSLDGTLIKATCDKGEYKPNSDGAWVDLIFLRELTLREEVVTSFRLWATK